VPQASLPSFHGMVGRTPAMRALLRRVERVAPFDVPILIQGESGTGKELVATAIHQLSRRQPGRFEVVNCGALTRELLLSELFGHERGAFTGAIERRAGLLAVADGGTVFLDEVGELAPGCQAKLLRLLEDRRFERLGGHQVVEVDVRIIAATNKDLGRAIAEGQFREDLFYRLNVLGITLPPLRERREDIPHLVAHFLKELGAAHRKLTPEAEEKLLSCSWPGNVRQLRNVIESAVVLGEGADISASDLVLPPQGQRGDGGAGGWEPLTLEEVQRRHILRVLEHTGGNKKRAADLLGIERCTLYAKLKGLAREAEPKGPSGPEGTGKPAVGDPR
jgi:DNA-binding NtrC family response regulator